MTSWCLFHGGVGQGKEVPVEGHMRKIVFSAKSESEIDKPDLSVWAGWPTSLTWLELEIVNKLELAEILTYGRLKLKVLIKRSVRLRWGLSGRLQYIMFLFVQMITFDQNDQMTSFS